MAKKPADIKFIPLNQSKEHSSAELMELYSGDSHLKSYLPIIRDSPVYPVIYDSNNVVLSLPPIINGEHSKITLNTKNIFFEVTATDLTKASIVLDTLVTMFSQYCDSPFTVEPVETVLPGGQTLTYPKLSYRTESVAASRVNANIGVNIKPEEMSSLLTKMCLPTEVAGDTLTVTVPPTRADVLHPADIYEDVAIAHGYNNIVKTIPKTLTVAKQLPINKLTDQLREAVAQAGFTEVDIETAHHLFTLYISNSGPDLLSLLPGRCRNEDEEEDRGHPGCSHFQPQDSGVPSGPHLPAARPAEDHPGQQEHAAPSQTVRDLRRRPQGRRGRGRCQEREATGRCVLQQVPGL